MAAEYAPYQTATVTWPTLTQVQVTWDTALSELTPPGEVPPPIPPVVS